jgi:hypothetical protein
MGRTQTLIRSMKMNTKFRTSDEDLTKLTKAIAAAIAELQTALDEVPAAPKKTPEGVPAPVEETPVDVAMNRYKTVKPKPVVKRTYAPRAKDIQLSKRQKDALLVLFGGDEEAMELWLSRDIPVEVQSRELALKQLGIREVLPPPLSVTDGRVVKAKILAGTTKHVIFKVQTGADVSAETLKGWVQPVKP